MLLAVALYAQQGAGADHVIAAVDAEKFQGRPGFRAILDLVQDQDRLARLKNSILAKKGREHHHNVVDLQRTGKDRSIIRILEEIEVHCVFVILSGKFQYRKGLAALTAALDDKRLPAGRVFPCKQLVCDLSP